MRVDVPEFKRCCFCIPLRYGLLGWGYIKLIFCTILIICLLVSIIEQMIRSRYPVSYHLPQLLIMVFVQMVLILDVGMTIVFVIGGHQKKVRLLKIFYIYSFVMLCLLFIFSSIIMGFQLYYMYQMYHYFVNNVYVLNEIELYLLGAAKIISLLANLGVDAYVLLLLRSEIKKLRNDCNFRFANVANEAQCSMENGKVESENESGDLNNGTDDAKIGIYDQNNGIDDQYVDIDKAKENGRKNFNYDKF